MQETTNKEKPKHFNGKEAIEHVVEAQVQGILSTAEIHGTEIPGHISSAADAARETALILAILWLILLHLALPFSLSCEILGIFAFSWTLWKGGRSGWLAWSRLERMHRVIEQERWEIQHHRPQEREELKDLYRAKGFEGKLLEDVIDVLMADEERLLRVMVEEELCLSIGTQEHPLKQACGAAIGTIIATLVSLASFYILPNSGILIGGLITLSIGAGISAHYGGNRLVPAIVWNLGLATLSYGSIYYLLKYVK